MVTLLSVTVFVGENLGQTWVFLAQSHSQGCSHITQLGLERRLSHYLCGHGAIPYGLSAWAGWASLQHGSLSEQTTSRVIRDLSERSTKQGRRLLWPSLRSHMSRFCYILLVKTVTKHPYFQGRHGPYFSGEQCQSHIVRTHGVREFVVTLFEEYNLLHN